MDDLQTSVYSKQYQNRKNGSLTTDIIAITEKNSIMYDIDKI